MRRDSCQLPLTGRVAERSEQQGHAHGQLVAVNLLLHLLVEVEQGQPFAHAIGGHADRAGDAGQCRASFEQATVRTGFFDWRQVGALEVFDELDLE